MMWSQSECFLVIVIIYSAIDSILQSGVSISQIPTSYKRGDYIVRDFLGEMIGTFLLVLFGIGSVAVTILFSAHVGLFQIAMIWGIGVALAIYATRHLSCAHLNPAVSIAMVVGGRMNLRQLPLYVVAQFVGAFLAAGVVFLLFSDSISQFEVLNHIVRGMPSSIQTAKMFGEFFNNAGGVMMVTVLTAFLSEAIGTFILVFLIFSLTEGCNIGRPDDTLAPFFIGLTVTVIISVFAPLTQAGLNPARDLAPRVFSMIVGWGWAAMPSGSLIVYVMGPIVGGSLAALLFTQVIEPTMKIGKGSCSC